MSDAVTAALAVRLDAIRSLAEVAQTALPLGLNAVYVGGDGVLAISRPPRPARLQFAVGTLVVNLAVSPVEGVSVGQLWAEVGFVPYTAESPERRQALLAILRGTRTLERARFVLENGQKILLMAEMRKAGHFLPEDLIYEIVQVMQEAQPFLSLLAEYLAPR